MEMDIGKKYSIAALVCGILGIVGSFIPIVTYFTFILAILGIVFGVKGRKLAEPGSTGLATAGFVLGIIGTAIGAIGVICALWFSGHSRCIRRAFLTCKQRRIGTMRS